LPVAVTLAPQKYMFIACGCHARTVTLSRRCGQTARTENIILQEARMQPHGSATCSPSRGRLPPLSDQRQRHPQDTRLCARDAAGHGQDNRRIQTQVLSTHFKYYQHISLHYPAPIEAHNTKTNAEMQPAQTPKHNTRRGEVPMTLNVTTTLRVMGGLDRCLPQATCLTGPEGPHGFQTPRQAAQN